MESVSCKKLFVIQIPQYVKIHCLLILYEIWSDAILKTLIDFVIVNPSTDYLGDCLRYQFHHMTDVCFRK